MANESMAWGNIDIHADTEKTLNLLAKSYKAVEYDRYNTSLDNYDCYRENMDDECPYFLNAGFSGTGRWAFKENVSNHFLWAINGGNLTEDEIKKLEDSDFHIIYEYEDYEPGMEVYYWAVDRLIHKKSVPLLETEFVQDEYKDLDISWGNRLREELESECGLVDMLGDIEPLDVYDFLKNERKSLEEYFEETLENHAEYCKKLYHSDDWNEILKKYEQGKNEAEGGTR